MTGSDNIQGDKIAGDKIGGDKVMGDQINIDTAGGPYFDTRGGTVYYQPATTPLDRQQQRNRRAMLAKVKAIWIDGLLEQSLAKELRIALDLTTQPDAVNLPLNALVQELNRPAHPLPAGMPIIEVFDQMGGALLILGAPGAGKTTLLLELARDLIARAEQDEGHPIPVVFNLSSWAEKRRPLKEWLIEELNTKYDVPRKVAQSWTDTDAVLPLLDGLDEVAAEHRRASVAAINQYRQQQSMSPLAVCSRVADYKVLATKLRLQGAIVVQPLTRQQVDDYLDLAGEKLALVRAALRDDAKLGEMLDTPLMLGIMILVYVENSTEKLVITKKQKKGRHHLFASYIDVMLQRRNKKVRHNSHNTCRWLVHLARIMQQQGQTIFFVERMQPICLQTQSQRKLYLLLIKLIPGIIVSLAAGLAIWIVAGAFFGLFWAAAMGSIWIKPRHTDIFLDEKLSFSLENARKHSVNILLISLTLLPFSLLVGYLYYNWWQGLLLGIVLVFIAFTALLYGTSLNRGELNNNQTPNQGIHRSIRNALRYGMAVGIPMGIGAAIYYGLLDGIKWGVIAGVAYCIMFAVTLGMYIGGYTAIQHFALRFILWQSDTLPWNYIPFLDYCVDRIFLRRVGGGSIFVHRLLMEHFASLHDATDRGTR